VTGHVVRHPAALRDLDETADYLRQQSGPERAVRFLREADSTFARLAGMPGIGTLYEPDDALYADLRFFPVSRFKKYLVFYRPIVGGIEVLRILHGARDIQGILADDFDAMGDTDEDNQTEDGAGGL
jgi:toxin ParE1/3/4